MRGYFLRFFFLSPLFVFSLKLLLSTCPSFSMSPPLSPASPRRAHSRPEAFCGLHDSHYLVPPVLFFFWDKNWEKFFKKGDQENRMRTRIIFSHMEVEVFSF